MKDLHIDIETYSKVSITDCGVYKYALDPSFKILLVAYAIDDEPTQIIDLASGEKLPEWFVLALMDHKVRKHAHNATFERVCFSAWLRNRHTFFGEDEWLDPMDWDCTMILASRCGLPQSLKQVGEALHLDEQKMSEGKALIQLFCLPHTPRANGLFSNSERALPEDFPEKWETFKKYCIRDVDVERDIERRLSWYEVSDFERRLYAIDQQINDRGALVDTYMARQAVMLNDLNATRLTAKAAAITGLSNPNSRAQLCKWLSEQFDEEITDLTKAALPDLMAKAERMNLPLVKEVLEIRAQLAKTSNAKYNTMEDVACADGRVRGMTQFYGTRTGRWAGRFVQMQNLPQNHIDSLDQARQMAKAGDYDSIELTYGNVPNTLSQLIRTAFIAPEGRILAVCDFSAIEARVLAWMAGEDWVLDVFRKGGDIYCATASQMFHVPVEKHGANAHLRQKGKVAVLALGYQGGVGALDKMGGAKMGMTEEEEKETVTMWRNANPNIVSLWGQFDRAAKEAITYKTRRTVETSNMKITFAMEENGTMSVELPSGRKICYPEAEVPKAWKPTGEVNTPVINGEMRAFDVYRKEPDKIRFKGMNQTTRKWEWIETYGGKITENITQAIARDCLAETMTLCTDAGFPIVFHIHDELVMEVPDKSYLKKVEELFKITPAWAKNLPLKGAGYTTPYYLKD